MQAEEDERMTNEEHLADVELSKARLAEVKTIAMESSWVGAQESGHCELPQ